MRWRSPIGGVLVVIGLAAYSVAAVSVADLLPDNAALEAVFYLVAGIAWVPVAVRIVAWARRDDDSGRT